MAADKTANWNRAAPEASVDAVVLGGGPAGLSAATWLARYRRSVAVVDSGEYRNASVIAAHGYLGLPDVDPADLRERALAHLLDHDGVTMIRSRATTARSLSGRKGPCFSVELEDGRSVEGRRVVVATGVRDRLPTIHGFAEHYGASAFHCPTCDGYEARDRSVVVLGWSEHVAGFATSLLDWAATVTIVTDGNRFEGGRRRRKALAELGVRVLEDRVTELVGPRGDLRCAVLGNGDRLDCDLLFFSIAHEPSNQLATDLGCDVTAEGCVIVDHERQTTVPGVYAAGDLTPGMQLVQIAAADGAIAGVSCAQSLRGEDAAPGRPRPGPDPEALAG